MKNLSLLIVSVLLPIGIWGCSNTKEQSAPTSEPYSLKEAIVKGDIVFTGNVDNFDTFEQFISNLAIKKADNIRITSYTDEGDPIFKDLEFDGNVISYTYDTSLDAYGGSNIGIRTDTCSQVTSKENSQGETIYSMSGCTATNPEIDYFLLLTQ